MLMVNRKRIISNKTLVLFILLFLVFLAINSKWVFKLMYPIKYEKEVTTFANQYDVNPYLILSIIQVETRFNTEKVSKKGAVGVMQIMPDTAKWVIEQGDFPTQIQDFLSEPRVNIALGSWYLATLKEKYHGNEIAMIAAYNAGPGNVDKWLQSGGWKGTLEDIDEIPIGETRHYIQRVIHFLERYQWIYQYDFNY